MNEKQHDPQAWSATPGTARPRLSEAEVEAIAARLRAGEPLDERYQLLLFHGTREAELTYSGKETRGSVLAGTMAVPLQVHKRFGAKSADWTDKLVFGDNLQVLKTLLELKERGDLRNSDGSRGVRLCYIDPPFATKREFRGRRGALAYRDKVEGAQFIEYLRKRLVLIHELLSDDGALYLHLDTNKVHYIKVVLDEIFGPHNLLAEIVWKRTSGHGDAQRWSPVHETVLAYAKTQDSYIWNAPREPQDPSYESKKYVYDDEDGRGRYRLDNLTSPNPRPRLRYEWDGYPPPEKGWRYSRATMDELDADGRIDKPDDKSKRPQLKRYWDENEGRVVDDLWGDIPPVNSQATDRIGYPTQKPIGLLERIISASSNEGDLVLDCFAGSGTTAVAASALGRRWIAVDCGKLAIYTTQRRLLLLNDAAAPFEVCHAGLYDNDLLEALPFNDFRNFTLDLFGCRRTPFEIAGVPMAGKRKGDPVHMFPFHQTEGDLDEGYIESLHQRIGSRVDRAVYVIVPDARCDPGLFEDLVQHGTTTYFLLRVPYSVIEALHDREFKLIGQPMALEQVNDAVDAYGFDFIEPPEAELKIDAHAGKLLVEIEFFHRGGLDPDDAHELEERGRGDLAMVLIDPTYDGERFRLVEHLFGEDVRETDWKFEIAHDLGSTVMIVLVDVFGNELRRVVAADVKVATAGTLTRDAT
jgi:DNA modification methylase